MSEGFKQEGGAAHKTHMSGGSLAQYDNTRQHTTPAEPAQANIGDHRLWHYGKAAAAMQNSLAGPAW